MMLEFMPMILAICVALVWLFIFAMKVRDHRRETLQKWEHGDSVVLRKLGHFLNRRRSRE